MAEYEFLIFMSEDKLRMAEVNVDGEVQPILFQGDSTFKYDDVQSLDAFYSSITDTYSVDELFELDAEIFLVDCGANKQDKWHLMEKMIRCANLNIFTLETIFPLILTKRGYCNPGQEIMVEFLDDKYTFICDSDCYFKQISPNDKMPEVSLTIDDFSFLAVFDGQEFTGRRALLEETQATLVKIEDAMKEQRQQISGLLQEKQLLNNRLEELRKELEDSHKALEMKNEEIESYNRISRRIKVFPNVPYMFSVYRSAIIKISKNCKSGTVVKKNQVIATCHPHVSGTTRQLNAACDGKIVWLVANKANVNESTVVAVIGDENDDEQEMIAWGSNS